MIRRQTQSRALSDTINNTASVDNTRPPLTLDAPPNVAVYDINGNTRKLYLERLHGRIPVVASHENIGQTLDYAHRQRQMEIISSPYDRRRPGARLLFVADSIDAAYRN